MLQTERAATSGDGTGEKDEEAGHLLLITRFAILSNMYALIL